MSNAPNYLECYHNRYSDQATASSDQQFLSCMLPLFRRRDLDVGLMTLKMNRDLDILKMYLQTDNEVAWVKQCKIYSLNFKKYEDSSQGQRSRSNATNFQTLLAFTMWHIPTKLVEIELISNR